MEIDMADEVNTDGGGLDLSMLSGLLSNPEVMSKVSGVLSSLSAPEKKAEEPAAPTTAPSSSEPEGDDLASKLSSVMENKELMSKLPEVMAAMGPLLSGGKGGGGGKGSGGKKQECDKRTALLLALKPYMSSRRCEAIDYFIRINKLGDVIKTIT